MSQTLSRDIKFGVRTLVKNPAFTLAALAALAVGIGATTAIFSVANAVVFRPLPFDQPDELMAVHNELPELSPTGVPISEPEYLDYSAEGPVWDGLAAYVTLSATLTGVEEADRIPAAIVTPNFFNLLGVQPASGRSFLPEEGLPGNDQVAVVSEGMRRRHFGDADLVGSTLLLNGQSYEVVGVAPEGFDYPERSEIWVPLAIDPANPGHRGNHYLTLFGRLRDGVSTARAQTYMTTLAARLQEAEPEFYPPGSDFDIAVQPLDRDLVGDLRTPLLVLLGTAAFVILIVCTNLANLFLARIRSRNLELSVRMAMGAQRGQLARQLLVESLLISVTGGLLGLAVAFWSLKGIFAPFLAEMPRGEEISIDGTVLLFALVLSILTALLFGLLPSLRASRIRIDGTLRQGGRGTASAAQRLIQDGLVASQIAFTLVLLAGAGLMINSLVRLQEVDTGFRAEDVVTARLALPRSQYPEDFQVREFYDQQIDRISRLNGVQAVGTTSFMPLSGVLLNRAVTPEGHALGPGGLPYDANYYTVSPGYFDAMGIPLRDGRAFDSTDRTADTVVVDTKMAERFWPNESAVGQRLRVGDPESDNPWLTIVGVVEHVIDEDLEEPVNRSQIYLYSGDEPARSVYLVVRAEGGPEAVVSGIRNIVRSVDRNLPVYDIATMEERMDQVMARQRFATLLMIVFGIVGVILAAVGIYGTMSYAVSQRYRELGIRLALGSGRMKVLALVLRRGLVLALVGLAIGLLLTFWMSRAMSGLLYDVEATDLATLAAVIVVLLGVAFVANLVPAHRATRIDPVVTLKSD